jgi:hypothetical protein
MSSRINLTVAAAVQLHREPARVTARIQEVRRYRMLAPEFILRELSIAQASPKNLFGHSSLLSKILRSRHR